MQLDTARLWIVNTPEVIGLEDVLIKEYRNRRMLTATCTSQEATLYFITRLDFFIRTTEQIKREARIEAEVKHEFFRRRLAQLGSAKTLERRIVTAKGALAEENCSSAPQSAASSPPKRRPDPQVAEELLR